MHKQAAINTIKLIGWALLVAFITVFLIQNVPSVILFYALGAGFLIYFIYIAYTIEKSRLEHLEGMKRFTQKTNNNHTKHQVVDN